MYTTTATFLLICNFVCVSLCSTAISSSDPGFRVTGRYEVGVQAELLFDWSGVVIEFLVQNTSTVTLLLNGNNNYYNIFISGQLREIISTTSGKSQYLLSNTFNPSSTTYVMITKRTEASVSSNAEIFSGIEVDNGASLTQFAHSPLSRKLEFLGDSITCGYGMMVNSSSAPECSDPKGIIEDNWLTYAALIGRHFRARVHIESWSGKGLVKNYGDTPPSSDPFPIYFNRTIGVQNTPTYNYSEFQPDAVIINLGTNDYSHPPVPSQLMFEEGYRTFLNQIRNAYARDMIFFLVCGPMTGSAESCPFVSQVADTEINTYYIDMQDILSDTEFGCGGHPNVYGHQTMAETAIPGIGAVLGWD